MTGTRRRPRTGSRAKSVSRPIAVSEAEYIGVCAGTKQSYRGVVFIPDRPPVRFNSTFPIPGPTTDGTVGMPARLQRFASEQKQRASPRHSRISLRVFLCSNSGPGLRSKSWQGSEARSRRGQIQERPDPGEARSRRGQIQERPDPGKARSRKGRSISLTGLVFPARDLLLARDCHAALTMTGATLKSLDAETGSTPAGVSRQRRASGDPDAG